MSCCCFMFKFEILNMNLLNKEQLIVCRLLRAERSLIYKDKLITSSIYVSFVFVFTIIDLR